MSPLRALAVGLVLLLGAVLAVGTFGGPAQYGADEDYIAIERSQPEVFRAGTPRAVNVQRGGDVVVDFVLDRARYRVRIDPRTDPVTKVEPY
ncbi:MAG: hypothetical protein FJ028_01560 [Chloroflexi bacterium]|nr:hypothetical protein [Chloroflexota bacterium]